jgi:hypothetical protein
MESDVAQSKLDGQQDRDAQFRSFSSYANCLNDRNHCRAAAPDFDHPKHSRAASARSANLALPVWALCRLSLRLHTKSAPNRKARGSNADFPDLCLDQANWCFWFVVDTRWYLCGQPVRVSRESNTLHRTPHHKTVNRQRLRSERLLRWNQGTTIKLDQSNGADHSG